MIDKKEENLLANHDWSFPVPIAYGPGRLKTLGQQASDLAVTHPLIVTDKGSAALPFIESFSRPSAAQASKARCFLRSRRIPEILILR